MEYTEFVSALGDVVIVRQNEDGTTSFIPKDPANSDYQRYLRWLDGEDESATLP